MRLTIAYSKIKKRNLVLINNATYQRETLSERPIRQPVNLFKSSSAVICDFLVARSRLFNKFLYLVYFSYILSCRFGYDFFYKVYL